MWYTKDRPDRHSYKCNTDTLSENSLTFDRGFLALAPPNSACVQTEPPPLTNWTRDKLQVSRITRVYPLGDLLEASPSLVGAQLIKILLGDIYKRNDRIPLGAMAGNKYVAQTIQTLYCLSLFRCIGVPRICLVVCLGGVVIFSVFSDLPRWHSVHFVSASAH